MGDEERRLVYSTDGSTPLPKYARPRKANDVPASVVPSDGIVRVGCERRRGGSLTLVYGLEPNELTVLAADLKRRCGTGGSVKDGVVALQGDKRDVVLAYLSERGRRVKRMGG